MLGRAIRSGAVRSRRRVSPPSAKRTFLEPAGSSSDGIIQAASSGGNSSSATPTNPAFRKLAQERRKAAEAAAAPPVSPQLLATNASLTPTQPKVDKGKGRERDEGQVGTDEASEAKLVEGEWIRSSASPAAQLLQDIQPGNTPSTGEETSRSFAEHASRSSPISNSLLLTNPDGTPSSGTGQTAQSGDPSTSASSTPTPLFGTNSSSSSSSGSSSSSSSTGDSAGVGFLPFLPLHSMPIPTIRHPFHTNKFVSVLEGTGEFSRGASEEIMRATKALLTMSEDNAARNLVAKADLENEAYLFSAALSELRTEVQMTARTDAIALRSLNSQLQREVDSLAQKLREDMNSLKNDNQLDFNQRKEEASADLSAMEQRILDLNSKFSLMMGDCRAVLEANKWIQTRRAIVMIAFLALCVMAYVSSKPVPPPPAPPRPPSAAELGLKQIEEPDSADIGFFGSFFTSSTDKKKEGTAKEGAIPPTSGSNVPSSQLQQPSSPR